MEIEARAPIAVAWHSCGGLCRLRGSLQCEGLGMRRWATFLCGVLVGGLLLYGLLSFHLVRADDGLHLVRKVDAQLASTYVDIRDFGPADWIEHPEVFNALAAAGRRDLIRSAAEDALHNGLDRLLKPREP
jgi:hypothetical protein